MRFRSIKTIISNSFKSFFRNMSNDSSNKFKYVNFFNNKFIIFMSLVPKRYIIIVINIYYTIFSKTRSTTITKNIRNNFSRVREFILFSSYIETIRRIVINFIFNTSKFFFTNTFSSKSKRIF